MTSHFTPPPRFLTCLLAAAVLSLPACKPAASPAPPAAVPAAGPSSAAETALTDALHSRIDGERAIGFAAAVRTADAAYFASAGQANMALGAPVTPETIFEIGSISKAFTGIILADMVLKGEVALDDPASKYLPDNVKMPGFDGKSITLLDLATHRSSLPRLPENLIPKAPSNPYADYSTEQMYAFLSGYTLTRPIGETAEYSNLGMGLLGHILSLKAGTSYEQLLQDRILTPLGMSNTFVSVPDDRQSDFAAGYDVNGKPTSHWDLPALAGAGAIRSNAKDMMIFLQANMGPTDTPLSGAIALSHKIQSPFEPSNMDIGLAWLTDSSGDGKVVWHNGGTGGFRSFIGFDPDTQRGAVVLGNGQDDTTIIGRAIIAGDIASIKPKQEDPTLTFSPAELEALTGKYALAPEFIITITHTGGQLFAQATGQPKFPVFAETKDTFFFKVVEASLTFVKANNGEVTALVLDQGGAQNPAKKID